MIGGVGIAIDLLRELWNGSTFDTPTQMVRTHCLCYMVISYCAGASNLENLCVHKSTFFFKKSTH